MRANRGQARAVDSRSVFDEPCDRVQVVVYGIGPDGKRMKANRGWAFSVRGSEGGKVRASEVFAQARGAFE